MSVFFPKETSKTLLDTLKVFMSWDNHIYFSISWIKARKLARVKRYVTNKGARTIALSDFGILKDSFNKVRVLGDMLWLAGDDLSKRMLVFRLKGKIIIIIKARHFLTRRS